MLLVDFESPGRRIQQTGEFGLDLRLLGRRRLLMLGGTARAVGNLGDLVVCEVLGYLKVVKEWMMWESGPYNSNSVFIVVGGGEC